MKVTCGRRESGVRMRVISESGRNKSEMPGEGEVAEHVGHFNCFYIFQHDCMSGITHTHTHTHTRSSYQLLNTCILHCLLYPAMNDDAPHPTLSPHIRHFSFFFFFLVSGEQLLVWALPVPGLDDHIWTAAPTHRGYVVS